jgi:hypothetical protein
MPRERERERDQDQDQDREGESQAGHGRPAPDVRDLPTYIESRHRILQKLYDDHRRWEKSLNAARVSSGVSVTWFNHEGERRVMVINGAFMSVHWKIIRSLILDLAECGPAGQEILRQLAVPKGRPHA